jgi:hypothetical protein
MRMIRKVLLAACAAALTTSPAWALPGRAPANDGTAHAPSTVPAGPPSTTPANGSNPGSDERGSHSQQARHQSNAAPRSHDHPAQSHKCKPHRVAYVAAGLLVDQTLVLDGGEPTPTIATASAAGDHGSRPTYSGDVTIDVKRTNRHARADKGTTKTYALDHARVLLGLSDQNGDGVVDLGDVVPGSRAKVIGKVTQLAKRCDQTGFTPELRIRKLILHAPPASQS